MTDRVLIDTNVLVYAYDRSEPKKQSRALQVLDRLATSGLGVLTSQVLAEFLVAVTRRVPAPLSAHQAYERLQNHVHSWTVLEQTGLIVLEAAQGGGGAPVQLLGCARPGYRSAQSDSGRVQRGFQRRIPYRGRAFCEPVCVGL